MSCKRSIDKKNIKTEFKQRTRKYHNDSQNTEKEQNNI